MPTRQEVYQAIINADKAGDSASVRALGAYLKTMDAPQRAPEPGYDPSAGGGTLSIGPFDTSIRTPEWLDRGLAGAGKAFADIGRGAGQLVGAVSRDDVARARANDEPLMRTTAGKFGNVLGNIAALAPTALIPGANTVAGGATVGALTGLLQPSVSTSETMLNTGLGGVMGAAVPAVVAGAKTLKTAAEPFYDAGQNLIIGRALRKASGGEADAVAQRLAEASAPFVGPSQEGAVRTMMGEFVPGSIPTVGQAAGNAGVASLERAATAGNSSVTVAMDKAIKAQNAARLSSLQNLAGSDGARDFAMANRDATAQQLYGAARREGVDSTVTSIPEVQANIAGFAQRVPAEIISKAKQLAQINGTQMTDANSVQGMHWMKMAIDDTIDSAKRAGNNTLAGAYTRLQSDLLTGLDNLSPAYGAARKVYADMSRPINQMDTAQAIADSSINKLTGNLQPNAFAKALSDKTAQRATGFSGATLENTMEPAQMNALQSLLLDVQRAAQAENAGRGTGSDTVRKLAYSNLLDQSGMPTLIRDLKPAQMLGNLGGRVADSLYGRANREIGDRLAELMLDPAGAALVMKTATPAQKNALLALAQRGAQAGAVSGIPVLANAFKQ